MIRLAVFAPFFAWILAWLAVTGPAAAQSITCPPGSKLGGTESDAGKFQWCEQAAPGGAIRHGPMVGFHPNGRRSIELTFVDGTPRGAVRAWYEGGQPSMTGETRPDNGTLILWDERGRKRAQIDVRERRVVTRAWDEQGREERYDEAKLAKALPANRNLGFVMQLWAVGIGIQ
ncbi:MAG: toxin-antitoxin system YwqK family antitoxin [Candidatus Rokuibacteriota bacterium]